MPEEIQEIDLTCRLSTADFRCSSYGFLPTMNPAPSESGTSFSGFLILMCSAWKFPSIIKPHIKRFWLKQNVGSFQVAICIDRPIFILSPILRDIDSRLCTQTTEYSHQARLQIFTFSISTTEPLLSNKSSPQSADP